jgi:hypothetical protein
MLVSTTLNEVKPFSSSLSFGKFKDYEVNCIAALISLIVSLTVFGFPKDFSLNWLVLSSSYSFLVFIAASNLT